MRHNDLRLLSGSELLLAVDKNQQQDFWKDILRRGDIALLTSRWKFGKTSLVLGYIRQMELGAPFLDRSTSPAKVWIISEESLHLWAERQRRFPLSGSVQLLSRPFASRPTFEQWVQLLDDATQACQANQLDLFIIDPLASFLPGRCEADSTALLDCLQLLHNLTDTGATVLLLHHPKKNGAKSGSLARGSGALLGFVDVSLELTAYSRFKTDSACRTLSIQSRHQSTPDQLSYEWNAATGEFRAIQDRRSTQLETNLHRFLSQFQTRTEAATLQEIRTHWPVEDTCPALATFYNWAQAAVDRGLLQREGSGTRTSPWRYRLP